MVETWRVIPSLGGRYLASDLGRIRHVDGQPRRLKVQSNKYLSVNMIAQCGRVKTFLVHRLVAEAFIGAPPEGYTVDHLNGDRQDNRPANLQWVTVAVNSQRRFTVRAATGALNIEFRDDRPTLPWLVRVKRLGKTTNVGSFASIAEAIKARDDFKKRHDHVRAGYGENTRGS